MMTLASTADILPSSTQVRDGHSRPGRADGGQAMSAVPRQRKFPEHERLREASSSSILKFESYRHPSRTLSRRTSRGRCISRMAAGEGRASRHPSRGPASLRVTGLSNAEGRKKFQRGAEMDRRLSCAVGQPHRRVIQDRSGGVQADRLMESVVSFI
jgi:hypothetical protein